MGIFSYSLFLNEFKRNFKSLMIWSLSLGLALFLVIMLYPLVSDMMEALGDMMSYFESIDSNFVAFLEIFGGIPSTGIEYFATEGALFLQLIGGIYAALIGFSIINKDEKEKTVEIIYVLPIKRHQLLMSKILNVATSLLIFSFIQIAFVHIGFLFVSPNESFIDLWFFGLFDYIMFLMIAILSMGLACLLKPNQSNLIAMIIPFSMYIATMLAFATDHKLLNYLKYLSPFTFTEPVGWFKEQSSFEAINFYSFIIVSMGVLMYSLIVFRKREIV